MRLWVRLYPDGDAIRDQAHADLQAAFRALVGQGLRSRSEVPFEDQRDRRAWDQTLEGDGGRAGVEFDTRLIDVQAYLRRMALKRRDGRVDRLIVVIRDTRANRAAIAVARGLFEAVFTIDDPSAREALAAGRLPDRDALLLVRSPGGPRRVTPHVSG